MSAFYSKSFWYFWIDVENNRIHRTLRPCHSRSEYWKNLIVKLKNRMLSKQKILVTINSSVPMHPSKCWIPTGIWATRAWSISPRWTERDPPRRRWAPRWCGSNGWLGDSRTYAHLKRKQIYYFIRLMFSMHLKPPSRLTTIFPVLFVCIDRLSFFPRRAVEDAESAKERLLLWRERSEIGAQKLYFGKWRTKQSSLCYPEAWSTIFWSNIKKICLWKKDVLYLN